MQSYLLYYSILRVSLNFNYNAFDAADYGIVGDMYKVIPMMVEEIKKLKEA